MRYTSRRTVTRTVGLALLGLGLMGSARAQEPETPLSTEMPPPGTAMVFVNTGIILPVAPGADSAQAQFQRVLAGFQQELQTLATEIDDLVAAYRRQESMLDPSVRQEREQEILDKQQQAQQRQLVLEQESDRRRADLLAPILDNVRQVIEEIRAERDYSIVFDITESGVIAAAPELDITGAVLERLGVSPDSVASPSN